MVTFWHEIAYFAKHLDYHFRVWIMPIALIVGIFGQLLTLKACLTNKAWKSTGKIYYSLMAITDLLYLLSFGIISYLETGLQYISNDKIQFLSANIFSPTCILLPYAFHVLISVSFWNLSAYSLERLLAIWLPFIRMQYLTMKNARIVCAILCTVAVLGYLPMLFTKIFVVKGGDGAVYCKFEIFKENIAVQIWYWFMTLGITVLFGPVLLLITNILLLIKLHAYCEAKKVLFRPNFQPSGMKVLPNAEVANAKTVVILSIATGIILLPMASWIAWVISDCMSRIELYELNSTLSAKSVMHAGFFG